MLPVKIKHAEPWWQVLELQHLEDRGALWDKFTKRP